MKTTTNINPIDRIQRIAMTGDIAEPKPLSPVENIMQHYPKVQAQEPEEGGFWNGLKNFAGSKGGRMLIGGLGTGLAVGLTGGGLQNALGYGVIGAGKTAENLYNQEQKAKEWEEKEAERLFRQQEGELNRQHDWDIANARIEADRQARKDEMDRVLKTLELKDKYGAFDKKGKTPAEQLKALADAGATPESLQMFAEENGLTGYKFNETKPKLTGQTQLLDYMVNELGMDKNVAITRVAKMTPQELLALHQGKVAINTDGELVIVNAKHQNTKELQEDKQAHDVSMAGINYGYDSKLQSQKDIAKLRLEEFKSRIPTLQQKNIEAQAKALGVEPAVIYQTMKDKEDALIEKIIAESKRTDALTGYTNAQTNFVTGAKTDLTKAQTENVGARTDLTNAQTGLTNARTGLTEAQTGQVGKTNDIRNAEWLANNPDAPIEVKLNMIGGTFADTYNAALLVTKDPKRAEDIATSKYVEDIVMGQIMKGLQPTGQIGGTAPVYPAEDGEEIDASSLF